MEYVYLCIFIYVFIYVCIFIYVYWSMLTLSTHCQSPFLVVGGEVAPQSWQAGFRKRRCTTDQCLRLSQFVSDGLQSTNKERTVLMLCDYSKAYDTVWRTGLLQKMLDIRVPLRFVQWTTAWLTNRIARV